MDGEAVVDTVRLTGVKGPEANPRLAVGVDTSAEADDMIVLKASTRRHVVVFERSPVSAHWNWVLGTLHTTPPVVVMTR